MNNSAPKINSVLAALHAKGCRVSASHRRWYSPVFNTAEVKSPASVGEVHLRLYFDAEEHWLAFAYEVGTNLRLDNVAQIESRLGVAS